MRARPIVQNYVKERLLDVSARRRTYLERRGSYHVRMANVSVLLSLLLRASIVRRWCPDEGSTGMR
jgi:hypothetical protein